MKAITILVILILLGCIEGLARTVGVSPATATAVWVACVLFIAKPLLVQSESK